MDTGNSQKVRRVAIVGPECTGKTDLARFLASHYQTAWVPEFARTYLETLGRPYTKADLTTIAAGQVQLENSLAEEANRFLFCDTNLVGTDYQKGQALPLFSKPPNLAYSHRIACEKTWNAALSSTVTRQ